MTALLGVPPHGVAAYATKTAPTLYTSEMVAAARRNITNFAWARKLRDDAVADADPYVAKGDDWLWKLISGQRVPRSYAVNQALGSPITGRNIYKYGNYPWTADPVNKPWKIVDPSSGYIFPTNDFAAFHASGLDAKGLFDPAKANRSLLVNKLYPEKGAKWGVDDGTGWVDTNGKRWTFVAYYNHWHNWFGDVTKDTARGAIHRTIRALRDAYLYTGLTKYAHAGLIMLDRVADVYPGMDISVYKAPAYLNSEGGTERGKVLGCIWETFLVTDLMSAYDAFFPAIATKDVANVVSFLHAKAQKHGLPSKASIDAIKQNIEGNLIRTVFPAVKAHRIAGNFGMYQGALATAAVVLDSPTESKQWIDWIFQAGGRVGDPTLRISGGNLEATLVDQLDRDGFGDEAAPQYNLGWITALSGVADALAGYKRYPTADLFKHPKYAKMIAARPALTMLNKYLPSIGDSGSTGKPIAMATSQQLVADFERYGNPVFAQLAYQLNHQRIESLYGSIFSKDVAGTRSKIADVLAAKGPLALPSMNLTGYGFTALRTGTGANMRSVWTYYGRNAGSHGHGDTLSIGMYGTGIDLMPDLGYPEFADNNARRFEWNANTISHNTVTVDRKRQASHWVGQPLGYAVRNAVQLFDVSAPKVYTQTSTYRRTTAMIAIDDKNSYVFDVFRVVGGTDHHFSFHAAEGPVTTTGVSMSTQGGGSYAGANVSPPSDNAAPRSGASGFDWLVNVSRCSAPASQFSVDWKVRDTFNVHPVDPNLHLRLTMLGPVDDVALCDGIPPRNKPGNPDKLRYVIAHRRGTKLASKFVSVIEPYVGVRLIKKLTAVSIKPATGTLAAHEAAAVKVELTNGRVDYVVSSTRTNVALLIDNLFTFRGSFGVYQLKGGKAVYAFSHDATQCGPNTAMKGLHAVGGTIKGFTGKLSAQNSLTITLTGACPTPSTLVGSYVYAQTDGVRNAVYVIKGAKLLDAKTLWLDIGDATPIRGYKDADDPSLGFRFDPVIGKSVRIPLTRQWSA